MSIFSKDKVQSTVLQLDEGLCTFIPIITITDYVPARAILQLNHMEFEIFKLQINSNRG